MKCPSYKHPPYAIKSLTTDDGTVYVCERCSGHWFRKYGDADRNFLGFPVVIDPSLPPGTAEFRTAPPQV